MFELLKLIKVGRDFRLQDEALRQFVEEEQNHLRDEWQVEQEEWKWNEELRIKEEKEQEELKFDKERQERVQGSLNSSSMIFP